MNEHPLNVGIIGLGQVARTHHIPAFLSYGNKLRITAVCGRRKEQAEAVASEFGIENSYADVDEMFAHHSLDIVAVCSPNNLHFEQVMKALDHNCHVICEKPPAITYAEAQAMAMKSKEKERLLAYNFHLRQMPEVQILKSLIADNGLREVYHVKATYIRRRGIPGWGSFTDKAIQGGGALIDIGIHVLDLALHLLDFPGIAVVLGNTYDHIGKRGGVGLMGSWDPGKFTVEDSCFAHIQLTNGCSITLETAFALNVKAEKEFNIAVYGSRAGAVLQPLTVFTEKENQLVDIDFPTPLKINSCEKNIHAFIDSCLGHSSFVCNETEGACLQKLVEAIYHSASCGQAVDLRNA
jgi:predicted dehydrogenase